MPINVNQRVIPIKPASEIADTSASLNNALRLKKKKCRDIDLLETLVLPQLLQSVPRLDAAIASAAVCHKHVPAPSLSIDKAGESPQLSRRPATAAVAHDRSAVQPDSLVAGAPLARQPLTPKAGITRAASVTTAGREAVLLAEHREPSLKSAARQGAEAITPQQTMLVAKAEQSAVAVPAFHPKLPRTSEEATAQAITVPQAAQPISGSTAVVTAEDAWFTAQAAPRGPSAEQAENADGMKLSYQFLRWGGDKVDIRGQPNQLLFQPSTEMVRDRLGESLLSRPQSQFWQMDEQPDRRQPQHQHGQNDEDEC